jgi:hypothetical protein
MELREKPTARATLSQKICASFDRSKIKNFKLAHPAAPQRSFVRCDRINLYCGPAMSPQGLGCVKTQ